MQVNFKIYKNKIVNKGELVYIVSENSFDFIPSSGSDITLLIADIQIGIDSFTGLVNSIWGYSPKASWIEATIAPPQSPRGQVKLDLGLEPGSSIRLDNSTNCKCFFDSSSNWLYVTESKLINPFEQIEFAENCIFLFSEKIEIIGLYMKPTFKYL